MNFKFNWNNRGHFFKKRRKKAFRAYCDVIILKKKKKPTGIKNHKGSFSIFLISFSCSLVFELGLYSCLFFNKDLVVVYRSKEEAGYSRN